MTSERSIYKGKPILKLTSEDNSRAFVFGLAKARLILENIEEIEKFVEDNE